MILANQYGEESDQVSFSSSRHEFLQSLQQVRRLLCFDGLSIHVLYNTGGHVIESQTVEYSSDQEWNGLADSKRDVMHWKFEGHTNVSLEYDLDSLSRS